MEKILRIPNVGDFVRHIGKLVKVETIQPPPSKPSKEYIFEKVEARCELRFNGEVLQTIGTLNDFYGLETSIKTAIEEANQYASKRNIGKNSELEVVVLKVVSQYRAKPINQENFYAPEYYDFQYLNIGSNRDLPEPIETIVWSSKQ